MFDRGLSGKGLFYAWDCRMMLRNGAIAALIIVVVVAVAVWSRLRYTSRDGYDEPLRWTSEEYRSIQAQARDGEGG